MKSRISFIVVLFISLAVGLSNISLASDNLNNGKFHSKKAESLSSRMKDGYIPIIVKLKVDFTAEGKLSETEALEQRSAIKESAKYVKKYLKGLGAKKVKAYKDLPYMRLQANMDVLKELEKNSKVEFMYENIALKGSLGTSVPLINGDIAFAQGFSGAGQTIAVIDTGVRSDHEFFSGKIVSEACYSASGGGTSTCPGGALSSTSTGSAEDCSVLTTSEDCSHGTHVSGIAVGSATGQDSGVAKDATLIAIKTATLVPNAMKQPAQIGVVHQSSDVVSALMRVYELRNQFQIAAVNISIGFVDPANGFELTPGTCDHYDPMMTDAINMLESENIATIISSGNNFQRDAMSFPSCISKAVSVGNSTSEVQTNAPGFDVDDVWIDSNISDETDLFAPGTKINSAYQASSTGYIEYWGTSMAAPHVAGAFAVIRSKNPNATVAEILAALKNSPVQAVDGRSNGIHSKPRIDIANALSQISAPSNTTPIITSPANGSTLSGSTVTFTWDHQGTPVDLQDIKVGSSENASDIYDSGLLSGSANNSVTVNNMPTDGRIIYVRYSYSNSTGWHQVYYTYTADSNGTSGTPVITSPANGSTLSGSTVTFTWDHQGTPVDLQDIKVGSSENASDIYDSGLLSGSANNSVTVNNMPTDGRTIYVRYSYSNSTGWHQVYYTYTADSNGTSGTPVITSPANGSTLSGSTVTFTWNHQGTPVDLQDIKVGSSENASDIYDSGLLNGSADNSVTVNNMPTDGRTIYVRYSYSNSTGWHQVYYTYIADSNGTSGTPIITSPANGSTLSGSTVTFTWDHQGTPVDLQDIKVGSSENASDIYDSGLLSGSANNSVTVNNMPTDGRTIYVRYSYSNSTGWHQVFYTYTASQ